MSPGQREREREREPRNLGQDTTLKGLSPPMTYFLLDHMS
jgi:hypothetical protein